MVLIRQITLKGLIHNVRIYARHVRSEDNDLSDVLSRHQMNKFWHLVRQKGIQMNEQPTAIPEEIWPMEKIWML